MLIGNGNHRVSSAITQGLQIECEKDADFGSLSRGVVEDPRVARIRFAVYGIEGIYPFHEQVNKYKEVFNTLNLTRD